MLISSLLGHDHLLSHLTTTADAGRIPHAQLFVGPEGSGTLAVAIAYAQYILCQNQGGENNTGNAACNVKFDSLSHPDLHFIFPTVTTEEVKSKPKSIDFINEWRQFVSQNSYGSLFDWYQTLGVQNKQGEIRVTDAQEIVKALSLKAYEGGYKIAIIWMADKMNSEAANKLLKLIEEPADKTVFIQGNYNKALKLLQENNEEDLFEKWFVDWVRAAFRAKGNAGAIQDLISWSEQIAGLGREAQKKFLHYCIEMFRQALLLNYQTTALVYMEPKIENFKLENFAPFVNHSNIDAVFNELSQASYHIERNGNAKLILTDLSIKLTRLIHSKG